MAIVYEVNKQFSLRLDHNFAFEKILYDIVCAGQINPIPDVSEDQKRLQNNSHSNI